MTFKALAISAALAISSGCGFAAPLGDFTTAAATGSFSFGATPIAGTFTDTLTFTIGASQLTGAVVSVVSGTQNIDFTSIVLTGPATFSFTKSMSDPFEVWQLPAAGVTPAFVTAAAGTYTLTLTGNNTASIASYSGNIAVTPIPEPHSAMLLLAGLGATGMVLRRRRS